MDVRANLNSYRSPNIYISYILFFFFFLWIICIFGNPQLYCYFFVTYSSNLDWTVSYLFTYTRWTFTQTSCSVSIAADSELPKRHSQTFSGFDPTLLSFQPTQAGRVARNGEPPIRAPFFMNEWAWRLRTKYEISLWPPFPNESLVVLVITWSTFAPFQSIKSRRGVRICACLPTCEHMPRVCTEK